MLIFEIKKLQRIREKVDVGGKGTHSLRGYALSMMPPIGLS